MIFPLECLWHYRDCGSDDYKVIVLTTKESLCSSSWARKRVLESLSTKLMLGSTLIKNAK